MCSAYWSFDSSVTITWYSLAFITGYDPISTCSCSRSAVSRALAMRGSVSSMKSLATKKGLLERSGRTKSNLRMQYSGTPGRRYTLFLTMRGHLSGPSELRISTDPWGIVAILRWYSLSCWPGSAVCSSSRISGRICSPHPKALATAGSVTSSWVGPMPPVTNTILCVSDRRRTAAAILSMSSRIIVTSSVSMPSLRSSVMRK
mmetsp:Transcript_24229/g.64891  ORF Transcript_24229/g.64891 Transcript_24229/m.64891 type:complete len:203 (-) Transcript_24229:273-881(-)